MDPSPTAAEAAPPSRLARLAAWLRPALVVCLLTFAAGVLFGNVVPTRAALAATQRRLDEQNEENARLKRRIEHLTKHAEELEKDPWLTEQILRDELKMSADGETIVR
jgi:cell division protein FtsB